MIKSLRLSDIAAPLQGTLLSQDAVFDRVSTDTRTIQAGDLFVALKGENFDAHDFVAQAATDGAVAAVVERPIPSESLPGHFAQLQVADTTRALADLASASRKDFDGVLVALTGSCGKTTVKEMLSAILSECGNTTATRGNLNNHIGAPTTLLAIPPESQFAVIEMGASGLGEIDYLASMAQPNVSLVNNVAAAHLEGFGSEAGVAAEKSTIYHHLVQEGTAVVNADELYAKQWCDWLSENRPDVRICRFSVTDQQVDVCARNIELQAGGGYSFELVVDQESVVVELPLLGKQNVANVLAAATCALSAGASLQNIRVGLSHVKPVAGRMKPYRVGQQLLVLDDSYNANPASVAVAAKALVDFQRLGKQVTLVLGALAELGADAATALSELGVALQQTGLARLITVGDAEPVADSFRQHLADGQQVLTFGDKQQVNEFLAGQVWSDSVVLVKGSRSSRMEEVVKKLTTHLTTDRGEQ